MRSTKKNIQEHEIPSHSWQHDACVGVGEPSQGRRSSAGRGIFDVYQKQVKEMSMVRKFH